MGSNWRMNVATYGMVGSGHRLLGKFNMFGVGWVLVSNKDGNGYVKIYRITVPEQACELWGGGYWPIGNFPQHWPVEPD